MSTQVNITTLPGKIHISQVDNLSELIGDIDTVLDEILGNVDAALDTVLGEDTTPMQEKTVIETVSGNALSAYPGKYYKFSAAVETLDITLNHSFNSNTIETIVFNMTGGTTPNVMFDSATGEVIYYSDGFNIESGKTYEVSALWNGSNWLIANINLSAQTS